MKDTYDRFSDNEDEAGINQEPVEIHLHYRHWATDSILFWNGEMRLNGLRQQEEATFWLPTSQIQNLEDLRADVNTLEQERMRVVKTNNEAKKNKGQDVWEPLPTPDTTVTVIIPQWLAENEGLV